VLVKRDGAGWVVVWIRRFSSVRSKSATAVPHGEVEATVAQANVPGRKRQPEARLANIEPMGARVSGATAPASRSRVEAGPRRPPLSCLEKVRRPARPIVGGPACSEASATPLEATVAKPRSKPAPEVSSKRRPAD
jgi:hypothetical protein